MPEDSELLERARDAARGFSWREACDLFVQIPDDGLGPEDLEAKADSLWWNSRVSDSMLVRQKAYAGYMGAGAGRRSAHCAWILSIDYGMKGEPVVGSGWLMRAKSDLADEPECVEHGLVTMLDAGEAHGRGDLEAAKALGRTALEIGRRVGSPSLVALATESIGRYMMADGDLEEGGKLLDETMASIAAGLVEPLYVGTIFCEVLTGCVQVGDLRRASAWVDAAVRWYEKLPAITPFHGICRIHKVELATLRGAWSEAEEDARAASRELAAIRPEFAAGAVYALGEISRRRGNLSGAEEEFARAHGMGHEPQPGLALVRLAAGDARAAAAGLRLALGEGAPDPFSRAGLLSAQVDVSLANGDLEAARTACEELDRIAARWGSPVLQAMAWTACAARSLEEHDVDAAATAAHRACRLLQGLRLPHEGALARLLLARASREAGDEGRAKLELAAALEQLEALGAKLDARRAAELLGPERAAPRGLSEREVEVLRLVAAGKTNREIASEMVLSEHTVSRHLQNIFRKLEVSSRSAATAFAFEHDLVSRPMV